MVVFNVLVEVFPFALRGGFDARREPVTRRLCVRGIGAACDARRGLLGLFVDAWSGGGG